MNKTILLIFGLAIFALVAFRDHSNNNDEESLKKVLLDYFDGIKNMDTVKMKNVTTADIVIYEEGKEYNNDSVFRDMRNISPYKAEFNFDNFKIFADKQSGYMSYYETAHFIVRDTLKLDLNFLGSAAFRKEAGEWKMSLLHSTQRYKRKK
jgi:uncharacterized protein DUF4440